MARGVMCGPTSERASPKVTLRAMNPARAEVPVGAGVAGGPPQEQRERRSLQPEGAAGPETGTKGVTAAGVDNRSPRPTKTVPLGRVWPVRRCPPGHSTAMRLPPAKAPVASGKSCPSSGRDIPASPEITRPKRECSTYRQPLEGAAYALFEANRAPDGHQALGAFCRFSPRLCLPRPSDSSSNQLKLVPFVDPTDTPSGVASGPMSAGSAFMLPYLARC